MRFEAYICDDGNVWFPGLETGATKLATINDDKHLMVVKTAGHRYMSGQDQLYGAAHFTLYEYVHLRKFNVGSCIAFRDQKGYVVEIADCCGVMQWPVRS